MEDENLGGNRWFHMSQADTPIAYQAAQYFNTSNERMEEAGGGLGGLVTITQDNFSELIRAVANLELEVQELKTR